jgi:hypothetical protein
MDLECRTTIWQSTLFVKHHPLLAVDEVLHAVDPAQVQDGIAHRRFEKYCQVAPGRDRNDDSANRDAEDFLRLGIERQARSVGANR